MIYFNANIGLEWAKVLLAQGSDTMNGSGPIDPKVLAALREEGERLHPALHGLAHVIEYVAPHANV